MVVDEVSKPARKNTKAWAASEFIENPAILKVKCIHCMEQSFAYIKARNLRLCSYI
jgi:hypothetical protein